MITATTSEDLAVKTPRSASGGDQRHRPMSDSSRRANREWYPGLCSSCVNDSVCTFPRSADHPVRTCDEFEGIQLPERPATVNQIVTERFAVANREWLPGLCKTCEKRGSCTFPKPEGGVFNCEEFE
ncbi:MAG: hypothetical protein J5J06_09085 [Phycisphaerae bacterium]|nr:hypothetical protein [Phycisphaerae bacterium]